MKGQLIFNETVFQLDGRGELRHHQRSKTFSCSLVLRLKLLKGEELNTGQFGKMLEILLFQTVLHPNY
jgi:hypothetical protein